MFLKSIVLGLVLANIGYFLWAHGIADSQSVAAPPATTLKLASEVPGSKAPAAQVSGPGSGGSEPDGANAAGAIAPGAATAGTAAAVGTSAGTGTAAAATSSGTPAAGGPELLSNVKRCVTIGPFRDVSEAAHAASTLRGGHYDPRQRVVDGEVWAGVWGLSADSLRACRERADAGKAQGRGNR